MHFGIDPTEISNSRPPGELTPGTIIVLKYQEDDTPLYCIICPDTGTSNPPKRPNNFNNDAGLIISPILPKTPVAILLQQKLKENPTAENFTLQIPNPDPFDNSVTLVEIMEVIYPEII